MDTTKRQFLTAALAAPAVLAATSSLVQAQSVAGALSGGLAPSRQIKILLLNPNNSEDFSKIILKEARRVGGPNLTFIPVTARFGPKYIGTEVSIAIAAHALVSTMADILKEGIEFDAVIIAGFGSSGPEPLQEMVSVPVLSLFDASVSAALTYGGKFSILTGGERWLPLLRKRVEASGLTARLASIRTIPLTGAEIAADQSRAIDMLAALSQKCANEDGASCVIHGGAAVAGLAALMHQKVTVPLIDNVTVAVAMAEALARAVPPHARSKNLPPSIDSGNLSANMADFIKNPR